METLAVLFTTEEVERARRYHRPLYVAFLVDATLGVVVLSLLAFTGARSWPYGAVSEFSWWWRALLFPILVLAVLTLLRLPLSFWRGHVRERIVLEPLFNRFRPLDDPALASELRALFERAGVPVADVLVADASRRTRRENAYVSGLGATRRIVLFDNLLDESEPRQIGLVVAHELGHRRARHVERATLLAMAGAAAVVLLLWGLLSWPALLEAIGASGPGDPRTAPFLLLVVSVFELIAQPLGAALSRRWEREADRSSLELTHDPEAFESAHRRLARTNLADLEPPRAVYAPLQPPHTAATNRGRPRLGARGDAELMRARDFAPGTIARSQSWALNWR